MKKIVGILVLCAVVIACVFGLIACNSDTVENQGEIKSIYNTYVAYAESNGENPLSYEEWLSSIKGKDGMNGKDGQDGLNGKDGQNGQDGVGIADMKIEDGKLFVKYTNGQNFVELGQVLGKDGKDGADGQNGVDGNDGVDGQNGKDGKDGQNGQDGVGIADMKIEDGKLFVKYTNGQNFVELGQVLGKDGKDGADGQNGKDGKDGVDGKDGKDGKDGQNGQDGVGIADMKIEDGKLFVKYTNSQDFIELGQVLGANGKDGIDGKDGKDGADGQNGKDGKDGVDGQNGKDGKDGQNGQDGVGIADMKIEDGKLFVKYTNGQDFVELGQVLGKDGKDGVDGNDGNDGADGLTPYIKDGYWWIGETNTNVKAQGTDGKDGENGQDGVTPTISISQDGYWIINGQKTNTKAVGVDGKDGSDGQDGVDGNDGNDGADGLTPYIKDGYWWIGETNTNVKAQGTDGKDGENGQDGVTPTISISQDGYWIINGQKTDTKAVGVDGQNGQAGKDGREIKSAEIDKDGNLIITYKDDTTENLGKIKDSSKCEHEYVDYMVTKIGDYVYKKEYYCIKCFETKSELIFNTSSKNMPILVNGVELDPLTNSQYYFNSKSSDTTTHGGFKLALNGLHESFCEGYWNIELSYNAFNIKLDKSMNILGVMYYDELGKDYVPLGSGDYSIDQLVKYEIVGNKKVYTLTDDGLYQATYQIKIPTKCIIVTKIFEAPAESTPIMVNGSKINPLTNSSYYFNSKSTDTTTHGGFQIDLNAMGLKDCEGYWNVELSVNSFDICIDSTMSIVGIMLWDKLAERYAPFGSGKRTIDQMLTYTLENGLKHYTLSDIGTQVARSQLQNAKKCIIVTKVLDGSDEIVEYNIFENK